MNTSNWLPAGTLIPPRRVKTLGEQVVQAIVLMGALAVVLAIGWVLRFLVLPIVLGMLLVYIISPLADRLEDRGLSRRAAVSICMGGLLVAMATVALGTWPSLESWLQEAPPAGQASVFELQLEKRLGEWQAALSARYLRVDWPGVFEKVRHVLQAQQRALVEGLPAMALGLLSHAGAVALALVITIFVLLDGAEMKKALVARVPNRHFENALVMLARVDRQIAAYLIGTAAESALVTVLLAIPLFLLGMPNAFLFAVIFGVANVIPFAGPFIGAAAGLFFCMLDPTAPSMGALVVVYVVVHLVDASFISPWVMGKSLDMHPLTVIVGISVGGTLGGVLGMLAIIPLIAVTKAIATTIAEGVRNAATD